MKATLMLLVVFILAVSEAVAQEPPPRPVEHQHGAPQQATPPAKPGELPPVEVAQIPIGTRVGTAPSGYDGGGRRDPFMTLVFSRRSTSPAAALAPRSAGLPSISITDVRIAGILRLGQNFVAIIEGPDKVSYSARPKDRLLDAVVKSIDAKGVVFIEQSEMTGPGREIRKTLRRAAEDNR